jgi:hypothetical protein
MIAVAMAANLSSPASAQAPATGASPADTPTVAFSASVRPPLDRMVAAAQAEMASMGHVQQTVEHNLMQARQQKDVVKVLCLSDKLSRVDATLKSAEQRQKELVAAVGAKDGDLANHDWALFHTLTDRGSQLATEANQCIGNDANSEGTSVSVSVAPLPPPPPDVTTGPYAPPGAPDVPPPPPGSTSPYK